MLPLRYVTKRKESARNPRQVYRIVIKIVLYPFTSVILPSTQIQVKYAGIEHSCKGLMVLRIYRVIHHDLTLERNYPER